MHNSYKYIYIYILLIKFILNFRFVLETKKKLLEIGFVVCRLVAALPPPTSNVKINIQVLRTKKKPVPNIHQLAKT